MRRIATAALLAFAIAGMVAAQPARAQQLLFDYVGFDYEDPVLPATTFGDLGNGYVGIGEVPFIDPLLTTNQTLNQYTYHLSGLISTNKQVFGNIVVIDYAGPGTLKLYEDLKSSGTAFDYGTGPPNGTAPSTFTDGTSILEFSVTAFRIILNTATNSGSYDSQLTVTGGSQFGNIPVNQQSGWQFAGITGNSVTIPQGYAHQVDGQTFLVNPTHSRTSSWGQLKRGYR